jgi:Xaa-Pro dipeptidase
MNLAFTLDTYRKRQSAALERMKTNGLDALIVNMPDNINYLCGFDSIGYLWYQALLLSPGLPEPVFFTRTTEEPCTWLTSAVREGRFYDIAKQDPIELVAAEIKKAGLAEKRIGIEMAAFTHLPYQWERLKTLLPKASFHDATLVVAEVRLKKSPEEIAYQRRAAQMADHGMRAAIAAIRPGMSEIQLSGIIANALAEAGSEYAAIPPMVTSGPRSGMIHAMASGRTFELGDTIIIEHAGVSRRYHAVFMRTVVLGRPSPRVKEVAEIMREATEAAIAELKPGADPAAPNRASDAVTGRAGITGNRAHRIGYSLGIAYPPTWLEAMMLAEGDPHRVEADMSFTIEPNMSFWREGFGYKIGETVLVTKQGPESLSAMDHNLIIV